MNYNPNNPLIVQSDMSLLLETTGEHYEAARDFLGTFAELRKSPEYIHTYLISPLSLWNAAAAGTTEDEIVSGLVRFAKYDIPPNVPVEIRQQIRRFGAVRFVQEGDEEHLHFQNPMVLREVLGSATVRACVERQVSDTNLLLVAGSRGAIKQAMIRLGFPVEDTAAYAEGTALEFALRERTNLTHAPFELRTYQRESAELFGGSGVMVLPCGAGKTIVAIACMHKLQQRTLILSTNITALRQWRRELLDKTTLTTEQIGEYSGEVKNICPVTLTTYSMMTYKKTKNGKFEHLDLFRAEDWGLIIYDEVHLLPAPVFRATIEVQARRRLGLTATLIREDGRADEVFSLIGPKRYDKPWKELEHQGFIAKAQCMEIRIPMSDDRRMEYAGAELAQKYRIAMENPNKLRVLLALLKRHATERILVIGQYLDQLQKIQKAIGAPIITGSTPNAEREELYAKFRTGEIGVLIVSKVANFAVDLPDATVAIQMSGTFRSRQEESQRLGRILRPKDGRNNAWFYSIVTDDSKDQECARHRSLFLTEQGYRYRIAVLDAAQLDEPNLDDTDAVVLPD